MKTDWRIWNSADKATWVLFGAAIILVYLFALDVPLVGPDEPRYAQVAREMFERGDWVTPTLGGANWFEKPALLYWLQISSFSIFGVSEFAARFGSALFGFGTIAALFLLGKAVQSSKFKVQGFDANVQISLPGQNFKFGETDSKSKIQSLKPAEDFPSLANYFAIIAATALGLLVFSRGASFDIIITFPLTAGMVGFFVYDKCPECSSVTRTLSLVAFYFFIGVGLLAKGLIGIVFPFAIVGLYYLLSRRWPQKQVVISLFWGTALAIAVAGIWYLPMILSHGWGFVDEFFIQHHFQRYTSNKYRHPGPFWYFLAVLPAMMIPWAPFFLVALWQYLKRSITRKSGDNPDDFVSRYPDLLKFASAWLVVPLLFFSVSGSKLPGYILPALPPAVIITGLFIRSVATAAWFRDIVFKLIAFAMLVAVTLILCCVLPQYARDDSVKHMIETSDAQGFASARILNMHTISHNAEFYGAGRLLREPDGRQWRFLGVPGVVEYMKENGGRPVLVLIPHHFEKELTLSGMVRAETLDRNAELSIVSVRLVQ